MPGDAPIRLHCSSCDVSYYLTARYNNKRRADHVAFYCPNGHAQHYPPATLGDVRDGTATFDKPYLKLVE